MKLLASFRGKLLLTSLLTVVFIPFLATSIAHAATFDPTRIIDDSVFYNKSSMSVQQIQDFLNAQVQTCDTNHAGFVGGSGTTYNPPWICLKDYYENNSSTYPISYSYQDTSGTVINVTRTFTRNNDYAYTALTPSYNAGGYTQGLKSIVATLQNINGVRPTGSISAAQIIWNAAQTYGINPQVILVTLQKENSLVTDTWAAPWQYDQATGANCPDNAACDYQYAGFYNQVMRAAFLFRAYANSPNSYNYVPGPGNKVYYNPDQSCGYTMLNIQNQATASLYDYTPYQPNAVALAAGYGTGDGCSAYGNRNFWLYFNAWFGSTQRYLIKTIWSTGVYLVENGLKRGFSNEETFFSYSYKWSDVLTISAAEMDSIQPGSAVPYNDNFRNWQLIKTSGSTGVYLVYNGTKRGFQNEETFFSQGYKWSDVVTVSNVELGLIPVGADMPYNPNFRNWQLIKTSGSTGVYLVYNGTKRGFQNEETFFSQGYKWSDVVTVSNVELGLIPVGADMPYNPNFRNWQLIKTSGSTGVYLVYNGTKRGFQNEETFFSQGYKWTDVVTVSTTELNLIPNGTAMPYNPDYRDGQRIETSGSTGVYLVYGGTKRGFPNEATFLSYGYKWTDVVTVSNVELGLIPVGANMPYNPNP